MATLPSGSIDKIWADFMRRYSSRRSEIPVTKNQLRAFVVIVDDELEDCEIAIVQAIPAGDIRDWLIANDEVGRDMMTLVENERREML
jgi:hypothetical protein